MGNSLGGKKSAKVMKITGETFKLKTPVRAGSVVENHPGHVLLESEAVKHYGVRAKPLEPQQELKPKRLYFLVELPKFPEEKGARRVRSGIQMSAKDRLESMMLARRSASDLSIMKPQSMVCEEEEKKGGLENGVVGGSGGGVRVKMRLPKAEVERLMKESRDGDEVAEKIASLCMASGSAANGGGVAGENVRWKSDRGMVKQGTKSREKRVGFLPMNREGEIYLAAAS
ncbi:hypothetical protein BUALT_Bualt17G0108000 [Buddleja alternifolia]|uniref:Plastid movement impaired 2 n=1 Tax=Buddleja alternifolia TaxID=168488 RepID=A0AAV6WIG5_9LAMI|nr:hypothetical protein BUALT_Bualt17G0108000 [Buddleja alternifolia]